jgi:hypothetical protein
MGIFRFSILAKAKPRHYLGTNRFDPRWPTCYKCPFCAGAPGLGVYFSNPVFAVLLLDDFQR